MENINSYFYFALFTIVFLFVGGVILYKWYFAQKYTRERFAFYSIWLFSGFLLTLIGLLLVRNQVLDLIVAGLNESGAKITEYGQVDFFPTAGFILLCAGMFYFLIRNMHQNWNGVPSTRQVDLVETNRRVSLLEDFQFYRTKRDQIEPYRAREKSNPEVFSPYEPDNRPWHLKAANLFSLLDQQYHINVEKDWYREQECFISRYGQDEAKIGILCLDKRPSDERLRDFFDFVDKRGGSFEKLIVAIDGQGPESSGVKMGREVQTRFESELLDKLISLRHYKDFIKDYFEENVLENSELTMEEMYVPLGGHSIKINHGKIDKDREIKSVEDYILQWVKVKRRFQTEHLAILGDYGQGKTILMHKIVYEILCNPEQYSRIPILIELRGLSPRNDNEVSIFGHWANRFKAKAEALWELHRAGKLLLILDGFDEMDLVGDTEMLFNHFAQLWALARVPNAQIIIAGRPNLFADDEQRRIALGIQNSRTDLPYAQAIYLDKLREEQINEVLRHAKTETKLGILNALKSTQENSSFLEIISRPSTLFQLSTVWDAELESNRDRLSSATVIGSFIRKTYERQERKEATVLTSFERSYFMLGIAVGIMLESGYSNQIKYKDLKKIVEKLWENYPPKLPPYQDSMQGNRVTSPLLERMNENNDALETILKDVRTGGILVQDLSGRDLFKFSHKSYLEYLISFFYTGFLLQSEDDKYLLMIINGIKKALNFSSVRLKPSMEVERFTSELIMSGIKLSDKREDANNDYSFLFSKKLFNILISSSYPMSGKFFPRIKFWLTLNSDTWLFVFITLLSTFLFLLANTIELKHLNKVLYACLSITFAGTVILSIFRYKVKNQHLVSKTSDYLSKLRIYLLTLRLLGFFDKRFSSRQKLIIEHSSKPELISSIGILILSISLSFSASLTLFFIMSSVHVFFDSSTISPVALVAFSVAFAALPTLIGVDLFNGIGIAAGIGAGLFVTVGSILIYFIASPLLNIPKEMSWMIFLINTLLLLAVISNLYWRELKKLLLSLKNRHS